MQQWTQIRFYVITSLRLNAQLRCLVLTFGSTLCYCQVKGLWFGVGLTLTSPTTLRYSGGNLVSAAQIDRHNETYRGTVLLNSWSPR